VPITYRGSVPDLFKAGRDVNVTGRLVGDSFVATAMTTKCPSKYTASTQSS
jgi:cytochrome c-type biogenesis protein CcmE